MFEALKNLDRRWVFLAMLLAVAVPILAQQTFPEQPTLYVRTLFNMVEGIDQTIGAKELKGLPEGSNVLIVFDYDPATKGELAPMATAFIRHCCLRRHKMYFMTLWETAPPLVDRNIQEIVEEEFADAKFEYGKDYVNLGYSAGKEVVISGSAVSLRKSFARDANGTSLDDIPMTENITNLKDMNLIFDLSAGYPGWKEWVQYASSPHDIPLAAGVTAVGAPQAYPYLPNQMFGLLAAIKGAAEYEAALAEKYQSLRDPKKNVGIRRMAPQLWGHLLIIGLIVAGNVIFFVERTR